MSLLPNGTNANLTDTYFAKIEQAAANWWKYPALSTVNFKNNNIVSTNSITLSSQVVTATPTDILLNGVPIVTSAITNWALYPAVSSVNFQNFEILSTTSIQLDDVYLSANANELLINGIPIVTSTAFAMMSSITDWAYFQALSSINMGDSNTIQKCAGIELNNNDVTTGAGNTIKVNGQNPVAVWSGYTASGNVNLGNNNIVAINSLSAVTGTFTSNVSQNMTTNRARVNWDLVALSTSYLPIVIASTLYSSTMSTIALYATSTLTRNAITSNLVLSNATNSNTLTTTGTTLLYNGAIVPTGAGANVSQWSLYDAVSLIRGNRGYANGALEIIGQSYFNGDVQMRAFTGGSPVVEFDRSSAGSPFFKVNSAKFYATGSYNQIGQSNAGPYMSDNYILGTTFLDGGTLRTISIGCLPTPVGPPINTQRIDVTPAGILMTTPTFVTVNGLGAMNIAMGGAVAVGAGSYITLEHGFGLGSNGVYVQVPARNDTARLLLEFGGSVGPSIDNPGTAAKVDFHGENLFIQNITNTFAGNRWPLQRDVYIDSVSTIDFVNGSGLTVLANSTLSLSGSLNLSTASQFVNAYNVSTVNLYVESVFSALSVGGIINFYDNITATRNIACYSNITAPRMATSTIYGTSGASIGGNLWLEAPLVTATGSFNVPTQAIVSSLTVSTINGIKMPNMPIEFYELTTPVNVWSVSGSIMATQTITITSASRIWAIASVEYNNTGSGGANNYFIDTWIQIGTTAYSSTRATIPDRFTPTVPSSTNVSIQQVLASLSPGTYTLYVYASASATNTKMTCTHCDFTVTAGFY